MSLAYDNIMEVTQTDTKQSIATFMTGYSCETTPDAARKMERFGDHLKPGTSVFITFLPGSDFNDTIETAIRLKNEGLVPVPILLRAVYQTQLFWAKI